MACGAAPTIVALAMFVLALAPAGVGAAPAHAHVHAEAAVAGAPYFPESDDERDCGRSHVLSPYADETSDPAANITAWTPGTFQIHIFQVGQGLASCATQPNRKKEKKEEKGKERKTCKDREERKRKEGL